MAPARRIPFVVFLVVVVIVVAVVVAPCGAARGDPFFRFVKPGSPLTRSEYRIHMLFDLDLRYRRRRYDGRKERGEGGRAQVQPSLPGVTPYNDLRSPLARLHCQG